MKVTRKFPTEYLKRMTVRQLWAFMRQMTFRSRQTPIKVMPVLLQEAALSEMMSRVVFVDTPERPK